MAVTLFGSFQLDLSPSTSALSNSTNALSSALPSPSYQPTRFLCLNSSQSLLCSGNQIHFLEIGYQNLLPSHDSSTLDIMIDSSNVLRSSAFSLQYQQSYQLSHSNTIQSLCRIQPNLYGVIDSSGIVSLLTLSPSERSLDSSCHWKTTEASYSVGWVGLASTSPGSLASCHFLTRELIWSDIETLSPQRKCLLPGNPTSISSSTEHPHLLYCGDGSGGFGVWDVRQGEKGGCVHYDLTNRSSDPLYSILPLRESAVAITGAEKTLQILDMKTWKSRIKWRTPCKYEAVHLMTGHQDPQQQSQQDEQIWERIYVAGRDNELLLCEVPAETMNGNRKKRKRNEKAKELTGTKTDDVTEGDQGTDVCGDGEHVMSVSAAAVAAASGTLSTVSKLRLSHHRGVRAESYWCGLDITTTESAAGGVGDRIVGVCGKGKMYVIENSQLMRVAREDGESKEEIGTN